jgi:hypothetical protein
MHCFWAAPGVVFDSDCIAAVRSAVVATGYDTMDMVSDAGHDACNVSSAVPTSMIFIPCEGGLSPNEFFVDGLLRQQLVGSQIVHECGNKCVAQLFLAVCLDGL